MSAQGLDAIFRPRSVAVVGASNRSGSIGRAILQNLVAGGFTGMVFPVNHKSEVVLSMKAYEKVSLIPDPVDLAVIVVPKRKVSRVLADCGAKGVRGAVVITAGFREVGGEGETLEQGLAAMCDVHGIRAVGPNCMGVIHTHPDVRLDASFARISPPAGNVAFLSQSGALGEAILGNASELGLGISLFASLGNQTDVTASDMIEYLEQDERTEVILLYQESFGDPRRFPSIAKRVARRKPIVAVKSGRTDAGRAAAFSHTGALAGTEVAVDALFDECGVLRVASVEELFDVARGFARQPLPAGRRVGIVTNAGGPGILAADACAALGFELPPLSSRTRRRVARWLNPDASLRNPVDLIASAGPSDYAAAVPEVLGDPNIDALLVIFVPPVMVDAPGVARAIVEARPASPQKPVMACFMGRGPGAREGLEILRGGGIPTYDFPEGAARALASMARYADWRRRPEGTIPDLVVGRDVAAQVVERIRAAGHASLRDGFEILDAYGIPVVPSRWADDLAGVLTAAEQLGYPVVLKVDAPTLVHKSDSGAVAADLRTEAELREAFACMPAPKRGRFVVQRLLRGARETVMGMITDPLFGPLIMFGLGGVDVEVLRDVAFKVHPLTDRDADELTRRIRGSVLLDGFRGEPPVDRPSLCDALLRLSRLITDIPEIAEIEINPFLASAEGRPSAAVDVRLRLADTP